MRHGGHQLPGGITRELGIAIERDYILRVSDLLQTPHGPAKWIVVTEQQAIEIVQFPALAFQPHPFAFARIPFAVAMEKKERLPVFRPVSAIKIPDPGGAEGDQRIFVGFVVLRLLQSIRQIGEQREKEIAVPVGEIVNLEIVDQLLNAGFRK